MFIKIAHPLMVI